MAIGQVLIANLSEELMAFLGQNKDDENTCQGLGIPTVGIRMIENYMKVQADIHFQDSHVWVLIDTVKVLRSLILKPLGTADFNAL